MHLLAGQTGRIDDGSAAVDLDQPPGDIVVLSSADTELSALATAARSLGPDLPSVRLANLMQLAHPFSVDLYLERTVSAARLVVVRLMGGAGYWPHGLEQLRALARSSGVQLAVVPGESRWDPGLQQWSTVSEENCRLLWRYLVEGGPDNAAFALRQMAHLIGAGLPPPEPTVLPKAGGYLPGQGPVSTETLLAVVSDGRPTAALVFYRALLTGGATEPVDVLAAALDEAGLAALPLYVSSLKDEASQAVVTELFGKHPPAVVLNATAFAVGSAGSSFAGTVLDGHDRPVLQVTFSGSTEAAWRDSSRGLLPRDLIMNVVLPELDGRLHSRAVSFKTEDAPDPVTQSRTTTYRAVPERTGFVARLAAAWVRLRQTPPAERRVAVVLSNYPNRDGRIANGVGLDTPESAVRLVRAMADAGYETGVFPDSSMDLMNQILSGSTNQISSSPRPTGPASSRPEEMLQAEPDSGLRRNDHEVCLSIEAYRAFLDNVPPDAAAAMLARWGNPEDDPFFEDGGFRLAIHRFGNLVVGIQPARGYNIDPKATYHDPDLVPPHNYLAHHAWLRRVFDAHAIVHLGKHGNLEWLPGKALGLSASCWPEIALGPTPLIYPFIVNDPGEGAQAKRRAAAVIVDHLMPALTRAELHGDLIELERLIDEYALAAGADPRRAAYLERDILALAGHHSLDRDLGFDRQSDGDALAALDTHLCDLKELQIRDGLHILGTAPDGRQRTDTLVAIARVPRAGQAPGTASLHRAIANDFRLGFDPLDCDPAAPWTGPRPAILARQSDDLWRTAGDAVERIELLAIELVGDPDRLADLPDGGPKTRPVLDWVRNDLAPALDRSGVAETAAVLTALDGRFVPPGPSGAPSRGRPEVLPTGRNFYAVDTRAVPTEAAWALGRKAAEALLLRYFQDEGDWPRSIALSAWGTSNMRTGGDDIAQVLSLIGVKPVWETASARVTGFEVLPLSELKRPRIDVTLKISGMFRDAFPEQIELIASAIRAVADLDEPDEANPLAAARRAAGGVFDGLDSARIFGTKPGAYGAGLQALIDEGGWSGRGELAAAFLAWGGFAYGQGREGASAGEALKARLATVEAVLHNQDNREHDILDSDDYYQFQGGLAAAVEAASGRMPRLYHGDHARPEKPVIRGLGEEIARVVRGRAANPKWIAGVMRHGYKGAFEIAATVDYLFAFAATTDAVQDHHFDQLYRAYLVDDKVRDFIAEANAPALGEIAARFREAIDRGLWQPAANTAYDRLSGLVRAARQEVT